jgi:hypothetical protein
VACEEEKVLRSVQEGQKVKVGDIAKSFRLKVFSKRCLIKKDNYNSYDKDKSHYENDELLPKQKILF